MANQVVQIQLHWKIGPQPGMNVIHMLADVGVGVTDVDQITLDAVTAFQGGIQTSLMACIPEDVFLLGYKARRISPSGGPTVTVILVSTPGGRAGNFSAGSVGPCLIAGYQQTDGDWKTGRMFLPGVSEEDIEENVFADALVTALGTLKTAMLAPHIGTAVMQEWQYGIYSRKFTEFSGAETMTVSGRPGTQRGRLKPSF